MPATKEFNPELVDDEDGGVIVYDDAAAAARGQAERDDEDNDGAGLPTGTASEADEEEDEVVKRGGAQDEEPDADDTSLEAKRARRRNERLSKKAAQRQRESGLRAELQARDNIISGLAERLNAIESRGTQIDMAQLDGQLRNTAQATAYWKTAIAEATNKKDGAMAAEATQKLQQCMLEELRLNNVRQNAVANINQRAAVPAVSTAVQTQGAAWMARNTWYNPQATDQRALLVRSLDASLVNEGLNPATPAYWEELDARIRRHKLAPAATQNRGYNAADDQDGSARPGAASQPRSPVAGSGRNSRAQSSAGAGYKLSAARVEALKEAGMWENPKLRAGAIQEYRDYDRKNGRS